jgi:hypothetical protein
MYFSRVVLRTKKQSVDGDPIFAILRPAWRAWQKRCSVNDALWISMLNTRMQGHQSMEGFE